MKNPSLRMMIFLALCCDLGLFSKRIINPFTNMITDALHIPGGIGTSFSLMFLVIPAILLPYKYCGTIMGAAQSGLALSFGMVGSMGALSSIGYIVPGFAIDILLRSTARLPISQKDRMMLTNGVASVCAAFTANLIVFRLKGAALALYVCTALSSGILCGSLGAQVINRLTPIMQIQTMEATHTRGHIDHENQRH